MSDKEKLIKKWLNHELSQEEYEAFQQLDEYPDYVEISEKARYFKAPDFDEAASNRELDSRLGFNKERSAYLKYVYVAAAVIIALVISFSLYDVLFQKVDPKLIKTRIATSETIKLPDRSEVDLNSSSQLSYDPANWTDHRELSLKGEAYFKVQNGNTFKVRTDYGNVQVLGTKFNVKSRDYLFYVSCYEGSVKVILKDDHYVLKSGESLTLNKREVKKGKTASVLPDWKRNQTVIKSKSLKIVVEEFKNYYDVEFDLSQVDDSILYTGSFDHDNLEKALKSITLPLGLSYKINDNNIFLSKNK